MVSRGQSWSTQVSSMEGFSVGLSLSTCQMRGWVRGAAQGACSAPPLPVHCRRAVGPAWRWGEDPGRATVSTKHRATQAPGCPCCRHTQKCMPLVHLQTFPNTRAAGATVTAQGTTRPCCTRMVWVQRRIGPRDREEALGTFWEVFPKPRAPGPRWPSEDPVPTAMLGWEDPSSTQIAQPQGLQLRGWAARARPREGGLYRTAQGLARSPSGCGVRGRGPLGKPQGRIWLDPGRHRTVARKGECPTMGFAKAPLAGSSGANSGCGAALAKHCIPGPSNV